MRGHEKIIELRKAGKKPAIVFVNDWPCDVNWFEGDNHATVSTFNDDISLLDLRFLVGMTVSISSHSEERAKAIFEASKRFGATTVGACHVKPEKRLWDQDGWVEVFHA